MADLLQDIEFLHLLDALMEHFLGGSFPLRLWLVNSEQICLEGSNSFKEMFQYKAPAINAKQKMFFQINWEYQPQM